MRNTQIDIERRVTETFRRASYTMKTETYQNCLDMKKNYKDTERRTVYPLKVDCLDIEGQLHRTAWD